jgi:putative hydrolase of the HAD superfamily
MTAGRAPVEAVIFDWGGTLTPWHSVDLAEQWRVYARQFAAVAGEDAVDAEELAARILAAEARAWQRLREDGGSAHLEEVLVAAGVSSDHPGHPAALTAYQEFWEPHTYTDPDVPDLLAGLRERGIKVGVLSNTLWTREFHERVFRRDEVLHLIDGAVYSSEIPWTKPHPEAFRAALAAVGVEQPERAVFVGDRPFDDIHGAKQVGMRAVLVPHSTIPDSQKGHVVGDPDAVVERLADVLTVVDGWR